MDLKNDQVYEPLYLYPQPHELTSHGLLVFVDKKVHTLLLSIVKQILTRNKKKIKELLEQRVD